MKKTYYKSPEGSLYTFFAQGFVQITKREYLQLDRQSAINELRTSLPIGKKIFCCITSVAPSGMSRTMRVLVAIDDQVVDVSWHAAKVLEWTLTDRGIRVSGCGMDMIFHLRATLCRILWDTDYGFE